MDLADNEHLVQQADGPMAEAFIELNHFLVQEQENPNDQEQQVDDEDLNILLQDINEAVKEPNAFGPFLPEEEPKLEEILGSNDHVLHIAQNLQIGWMEVHNTTEDDPVFESFLISKQLCVKH